MVSLAGVPQTMKAAVLMGQGGPEKLKITQDAPVPVPGPDEVLLRVRACGVNNTDINTRVGWYSRSVTEPTKGQGFVHARSDDATWGRGGLQFPRIQGADPAGTVVAVGNSADASLIGSRVIVDPWIRDAVRPRDRELAGYLGSERDGGFAQYCAVPERNVYRHESDLSDVELASFACSWSTAEHMLTRVAAESGQTIAVRGASGGVGSALVTLAKLRGMQVVAVVSASKSESVLALGADHVVNRESEGVSGLAVQANDGPFDVVADVVGGRATPGWFESLRRGGRYVTSGAIAGPIVDLDLRTLYLNDLELFGATVYEPAVFARLVGYIQSGQIKPLVAETFALDDIDQAQSCFEEKRHVGALVVVIDD